MVEVKTCRDCGSSKPLSEFNAHSGSKDGRHYYCRACHAIRGRRNYEKRKADQLDRFRHIERTYGISREAYTSMLERQEGRCAICAESFDTVNTRSPSAPCVDHNHATGQIRGLLCNHCNRALGLFKDNPTYMKNAIRYLDNCHGRPR